MANVRDRNTGLPVSKQDIELERVRSQLLTCSQRDRATELAILTALGYHKTSERITRIAGQSTLLVQQLTQLSQTKKKKEDQKESLSFK